jgi:AraC-like DNA-binding protein
VALIVETSVVYGRQILRGIARYLKAHAGWSVFLDERELHMPPPDWLAHWRGDGVICRSTTSEWGRIFRRRRLPVVDLNDLHLDLGLPRVASDMLAEVRCSRSVLERRFREHLGHSPQAELRAIQLRRVKELLRETDWTLPRIAEAAGIEHPEYLSVIFRRETGQTPGEFRQDPKAQSRKSANGGRKISQ